MRSHWSNKQKRHSPTLEELMGRCGDRQESEGGSCREHKGNEAGQDDGEPSGGTLLHLRGAGRIISEELNCTRDFNGENTNKKKVRRKEKEKTEQGKRRRDKERKVWETSVPGGEDGGRGMWSRAHGAALYSL